EVPTVDLRDVLAASLGAIPGAEASPGSVAPLAPGSADAKMTIPLSQFLRTGLAPPVSTPPPAGEPLDPRPPWQVTLDRALFWAGAFGERQIVRFRSAPQQTQMIVAVAAGTLTILFLGAILYFAMR